MKLTDSQKNQIYNEGMIVDDYEWIPCINHVLNVLGYEDLLEHDENYESVKWCGTKPLIKDEKIRKAVRAWAEVCEVESDDAITITDLAPALTRFYASMYEVDIKTKSSLGIDEHKEYTIAELCGEKEE